MSNTTNTFSITLEDITKAEELLSKNSDTIIFDDDSKEVIRTIDSCFVKACPGSGKTTILVAKLAILADKLPYNNKGICVLSHTNVAKNEIKKRIGAKSDRFFKYPNFIGTIQSFVDTYLAIPAMIERFKVRPEDIDNSKFAYKLKKNLYNGTVTFLTNKKVDFESIDFDFENIERLNKYEDLLFCTKAQAKHYRALNNKSKKVKEEGTITFNDAFAIANSDCVRNPCTNNRK